MAIVAPVTPVASEAYRKGMKAVVHRSDDGMHFASRVCLVCDELLDASETKLITHKRLKVLGKKLSGESAFFETLPAVLKQHYTYSGDGNKSWMAPLYLSPRGKYVREQGFYCCDECDSKLNDENQQPCRVELPLYAIANGAVKGEAPVVLTRLTETEIALICGARSDKSVFVYYGGAHKCLRGWHTLYANDVSDIANAMQYVNHQNPEKVVACILSGPFTDEQLAAARKKTLIRPHYVLEAMRWLKENNILCDDLVIPDASELPTAMIIDDSERVEAENTSIESRFEYTVVFPNTENVRTNNGGFKSQEEFRANVMDALDVTTEETVLSRPTKNRLKDYEGTALLLAFPLQFPYGYGLPQTSQKKKNQKVKNSNAAYLWHLQHMSIPHFQRGDFLLILHNMFERQKAVNVSYLRCINNFGEDSMGEHYASMTVEQLRAAIARRESCLPDKDPITSKFLTSIDAVCKSMGHSSDAAKGARLHVFAETVRLGPGSLFVTITPDDSNQFRIKIYAFGETGPPPTLNDPEATIKADFEMAVDLRQKYPGLCAFDFQQITDLFIEHFLGWDKLEQKSKPEGGAFGEVEAFCAAIEEQGRKTLHGHWIIWLKNWAELLKGLRSEKVAVREQAARELEAYIDSIMSTKLFGGDETLINVACAHECSTGMTPNPPEICSDQDLRNLRYKHGNSSLGKHQCFQCTDCAEKFTVDDLVNNVIAEWFGSTSLWDEKIHLAVKRFSAQVDDAETVRNRVRCDFIVQALCNLHATLHTVPCFKNGCECRMKLPQRPCEATKVHFNEAQRVDWWTWRGQKHKSSPFLTEAKRHVFDVFMNSYDHRLSRILGCNTNVQCGIDGGHMIYATYYMTKNTKAEDRLAYAKVAKTLYARIRRQEEHANAEGDEPNPALAPTPFSEGYRRLLAAVLSHTNSTVVSAPMAWFIMRNGSRFIFSHESAYVGLEAFMGRKTKMTIGQQEKKTFFYDKMQDYAHRPNELEDVNLYTFIANYEVRKWKQKDKDDFMEFQPDHTQSEFRGVLNRLQSVTPLVSYLDFGKADEFAGDLLDDSITPNDEMEKSAKAALCLFVPFRDKTMFNEAPVLSWTHMLRRSYRHGELSEDSRTLLQNIQECRNLLKTGRQKDMLERTTVALPEPAGKAKGDYDEETQAEIDQHVDDVLTELVAALDADNANGAEEGTKEETHISMTEHCDAGRHGCGHAAIRPAISQAFTDEPVYSVQVDEPIVQRSKERDDWGATAPLTTKTALVKLSISAVRRHVASINAVTDIIPDGTPTTIQRWGRLAFSNEEGNLDETQKRAFEVIASRFVLTYHADADKEEGSHATGILPNRYRHNYNHLRRELRLLSGMRGEDQLIAFLTGAAGAGKSQVINTVMAYAKGFCKQINQVFTRRTIVVTAMSGVAAALIHGETMQPAVHFYNTHITTDYQQEWSDTRLLIIDEISFALSADLTKLNEKLGLLKQHVHSKYGGIHILFTGDFSQLEPINGFPLYYETNFALWHDWVNCFIELTGEHRFKKDPEFGRILKRIREGNPTEEDIATLNTRVINGDHPHAPTMADLPDDLSYAVHENADRCAINNSIFAEHLKATHSKDKNVPPPKHTLAVLSDEIYWGSNKAPLAANARRTLYERCNESQITTPGQRKKFVDPMLKCITNMPMMHTENKDVANEIANGTLCFLKSVVLEEGITEDDITLMNIDGYWVRTIETSKVSHLLMRFGGKDENEQPRTDTFEVRAESKTCRVHFPIELIPGESVRRYVRMSIKAFPLLMNYATTGHKLQGQTKENLLVSAWNYQKNWPYVVLSRVKTLKGLFLRTKLDPKHDFSHDPRLTKMLKKMRTKRPVDYEQPSDGLENHF